MQLKYPNSCQFTITPYGVAHQLLSVYNATQTGNWSGETVLQSLAHSTLDGMSATPNGCVDALTYLNQKLEAVRKTISFWDAYQIVDVIDDSATVLSKLTQLPNNSSLITNVKNPFPWTNPITNVQDTIYGGDIFIKDYQGLIHLIHATNKGIYIPKSMSIDSGNSLTITYQYSTTPGKDEEPITPTSPSGGHAFDLEKDSGYNYRGTLGASGSGTDSFSFIAFNDPDHDTVPIIPIVKYFNNMNPVAIDSMVSGPDEDGYFTITNPTPLEIKYEVR